MEYTKDRLADYSGDSHIGRGSIDVPFLLLVLLLLAIGVVMVLSASFARAYYSTATKHTATFYFTRQLFFAVTGVAIMLLASRFPIGFYRRFSGILLLVSIGMLLLVLLGGVRANGARRWFAIGSITFQPSEIAKIGVILYFADSISKKKERMQTFRYGILPYMVILGVIAALMLKEPHFSGTVLILGVGAVMLFVGGIRDVWVAAGASFAGLVVWAYLTGKIKYNQQRIVVWRDPLNPEWMQGVGYQTRQSLLAIGSGGLLGVGLGQSRQKFLYLPERHNDFIFSIICEELGLIGATLIMALFAVLIIRGYWIALHARDRFGALLAVGVTTQIALQVFLNIAVVSNLIPNTGISLPFFSYGGTALVIQLAEMGLVLSVSRQMPPS